MTLSASKPVNGRQIIFGEECDAGPACCVYMDKTVLNKLTDSGLVERSLEGDVKAFEELVRRHQDSVYTFALRVVRDPEAARDVSQETFIRAYTRLSTFQMGRSFKPWLLAICVNQGRNRIRSRLNRQQANRVYANSAPQTADPVGAERLMVNEALHQLPEKLLIPFLLRHVAGLSYEEAAGVLGTGVSAVKMRTKRARDLFVSIMDGTDNTSG